MLEIKGRNDQPHSSHPLKKTGGLSVVDMVNSLVLAHGSSVVKRHDMFSLYVV